MTNDQWQNVLNRVGAVFNFSIKKKEQVKNSPVAKIIAATPFLAGCKKSIETSFSHLSIYVMSQDESAKDIFYHKPEDDHDIYSRLFPISSFLGGNSEIIKCCIDLVALCMLSNYRLNSSEDKYLGKYNPLNDGNWNYKNLSSLLIKEIDKRITPEISQICTTEDAINSNWNDK